MVGDPGPYMDGEGNVWVPRTVPYLKARHIAQEANQWDDRLVYHGKVDARLLGFTRDCRCEEVCELFIREDEDGGRIGDDNACMVPAWHFEVVER